MEIILASKSPRRKEILQTLRLPFRVFPCEVNEDLPDQIAPQDAVLALAERKRAAAVERLRSLSALAPDSLVLSSDTVVALDGHIFGKPHDAADARQMLHAFSGRRHEVWTGVSLSVGDKQVGAAECTYVTFRPLTAQEIDRYIEIERPFDKAGAYGIQGLASLFIEGIEGDYFNVVGLPVFRIALLARAAFGIDLMAAADSGEVPSDNR